MAVNRGRGRCHRVAVGGGGGTGARTDTWRWRTCFFQLLVAAQQNFFSVRVPLGCCITMVKQSLQLPQYKATGLGAMISALGVQTPQDTLFVAVQAISGTGTQLNLLIC